MKKGIIKKVIPPTEWVNSMVAVEKKGGILIICIDPTDLKKAIMCPFCPIPTLEDATTKLNRAKYFSKMDARLSYWSRHRSSSYDDFQCHPWQILLQKNTIWDNISPR